MTPILHTMHVKVRTKNYFESRNHKSDANDAHPAPGKVPPPAHPAFASSHLKLAAYFDWCSQYSGAVNGLRTYIFRICSDPVLLFGRGFF